MEVTAGSVVTEDHHARKSHRPCAVKSLVAREMLGNILVDSLGRSRHTALMPVERNSRWGTTFQRYRKHQPSFQLSHTVPLAWLSNIDHIASIWKLHRMEQFPSYSYSPPKRLVYLASSKRHECKYIQFSSWTSPKAMLCPPSVFVRFRAVWPRPRP